MTNPRGRPPLEDQPFTRCTVFLRPEQVLAAHTAGQGNVSAGLRMQLDELADLRAWFMRRGQRAGQPAVSPRSRHQ